MSQLRTNSIVPVGGIPAGASGGGIIQVVQATTTSQFTTGSTSFVDITGLSVSITPRSTNNKVLIIANVSYSTSSSSFNTFLQLARGGSALSGANGATGFAGGRNDGVIGPWAAISYLDSPASTSSTTYSVQVRTDGATAVVNRRGSDTSNTFASQIILMEVSG
jgi:hypothetical protein